MSKKDLEQFLDKIKQLNEIQKLVKESNVKMKLLSDCDTHDEVIELTKSWGFNIEKRWGEN